MGRTDLGGLALRQRHPATPEARAVRTHTHTHNRGKLGSRRRRFSPNAEPEEADASRRRPLPARCLARSPMLKVPGRADRCGPPPTTSQTGFLAQTGARTTIVVRSKALLLLRLLLHTQHTWLDGQRANEHWHARHGEAMKAETPTEFVTLCISGGGWWHARNPQVREPSLVGTPKRGVGQNASLVRRGGPRKFDLSQPPRARFRTYIGPTGSS